ncbi:hypothetical protein CYY_006973 [Polysphondylium violaceum]|uniref:RhoGAP domain-containing protein n=1 Tax=Polysphondylium violaceum TaxID=133409 RepID=A0A8J4PPE6_9MYCE|nr:hypothetical protein CYY_006973 [Polysphondylium violaceum]
MEENNRFKRASFKLPAGMKIEDQQQQQQAAPTPTENNNPTPPRKVTFGSRKPAPTVQPPPTQPETTSTKQNDTVEDFDLDPVPVTRPRTNRAATMIPSAMLKNDRRGLKIGVDRSNFNYHENGGKPLIGVDRSSFDDHDDDDDDDQDEDEIAKNSAASWSNIMNKTKSNNLNSINRNSLLTSDLHSNGNGGDVNKKGTLTQPIQLNGSEESGESRRATLRKPIVIGTHQLQPPPAQEEEEDEDLEKLTRDISSLDLAYVPRPKQQYHTIDPASIPQWKKNNEELMKEQQQQAAPTQQSSGGGLFSSILKASPLNRQNSNQNNQNRITKAEAEYNEYLSKARNQVFPDIEALNFIYPAGKDNLGRTVIVIIASHLPVKETDMDRVLLYTISIMDPVVEEDYVLVYVHTNMNNSNKPTFSWMKKVYTIFNRKYKKNLKGLYIVHPTTWIKFTLGLFKHFLSSKFWRKLAYIDDLADLFSKFPREQLGLPNSIMTHRPSGKKLPPLFGAPLEDVVNRPDNTSDIPMIFEKGLSYLERRGLQVEGIFRLSGANSQIKSLRQGFDAGEDVDLEDVEDVHTVAGLLKLYLRELPTPLFPFDTYSSFIEISKDTGSSKQEKIENIKFLFSLLPPANKALAKSLFRFLSKVIENAHINKMNSVNLSIVFAPNLLKDKDNNILNVVADAQFVNQVVQLILDNSNQLF